MAIQAIRVPYGTQSSPRRYFWDGGADVPAVRRSGLALGFQAIPFSHSVLSSAQIPESLSTFAVV